MSIYYQNESVVLYNDDVLKLSSVEKTSIDLIVTSPPYNIDMQYNTHDDKTPYEDYLEIKRVGKKTSGSKVSDTTKDEFMNWTNGLWTFNGESAKRIGHPAPFPPELPYRCIKLFSYVGDTVLDPFTGSGTTLVTYLKTNRKGIGIEIDKDYAELSTKRIKSVVAQPVLIGPVNG
jgi:DNA modification methylase